MVQINENYNVNLTSKDQTVETLKHIMEYVNAGHYWKAVRLFIEGQEKGILPRGAHIPGWLTESLGQKAAVKIVDAFARMPCFYCQNGLLPCETCEGQGYLYDMKTCDRCIGLGVAQCNFCNATGWVSLDYVPSGLQRTVINKRAKLAMRRIKTLLTQSLLPSHPKNDKSFKDYAQLFLDLNRQLGILENTLDLLKELPIITHKSIAVLNKTRAACIKSAWEAWKAMPEILQGMASALRLKSDNMKNDTEARRLVIRQAEYYQSLGNSSDNFLGTEWEHPFLRKAVKEVIGKKYSEKYFQ
ncbi:MAG: hypothetical protein JW860_09480 [Sedimentisphaerales bacterium]|nr:hypothetical protein [Sedimentisphaerales bacterium]